MPLRVSPLLRQRFFSTSRRARHAIPLEHAVQLSATSHTVPRLGRVARWYLPTMAMIALGIFAGRRFITRLCAANLQIACGVTNALHDANRKAHMVVEPSQDEKNRLLMEAYGQRETLEDMERAIADVEARLAKPRKERAVVLEEAYGARGSVKDLERAMKLYEVQ